MPCHGLNWADAEVVMDGGEESWIDPVRAKRGLRRAKI